MIEARVYVTLKRGVLDAQGDTVRSALEVLGFAGVRDVRIGKFLVLTLDGATRAEAEDRVHAMCRQLLANPVIEDYRFDLAEVPGPAAGAPAAAGGGVGAP